MNLPKCKKHRVLCSYGVLSRLFILRSLALKQRLGATPFFAKQRRDLAGLHWQEFDLILWSGLIARIFLTSTGLRKILLKSKIYLRVLSAKTSNKIRSLWPSDGLLTRCMCIENMLRRQKYMEKVFTNQRELDGGLLDNHLDNSFQSRSWKRRKNLQIGQFWIIKIQVIRG